MVLDTPLTCGGFAESGRIDAGPLSFEIAASSPECAVPATLWASSLDGKPLAESSRILLVHLTDIQGEGARYADDTRRILLQWGKTPLIEAGEADVELRLDPLAGGAGAERVLQATATAGASGGAGARPPAVWALDTAGNRVAEVPATCEGGVLRFRVSTRAPDGSGRIYYEILPTGR